MICFGALHLGIFSLLFFNYFAALPHIMILVTFIQVYNELVVLPL